MNFILPICIWPIFPLLSDQEQRPLVADLFMPQDVAAGEPAGVVH